MSTAGYERASGSMYWRMYSGHNCTNYAAFRMVQSGLPNIRPWDGGGNATYWGTSMKSITDQTPKVGAVAWWKAGVRPAGSAGHVAYVERVVSADEIIVSQDSWGGDFSWARITRASSGWPSGFVHFNDVRLLATVKPTVTGEAKVGSVLTATAGTWTPGGVTTTYQWRAGGVDVAGATASTFKIPQSLQGRRVKVLVTATKLGHSATSVQSVRTAFVQPGELRNIAAPHIVGDPVVDATLTADPGSWDPVPDALSYQWLADGVPVPGAGQPTLTPSADVMGKQLSVRVTAARAGYAGVAATSPATAAVIPGTFTMAGTPSVTGTPWLGQTLTVDLGAATPQATTTVQWLRGGAPIPGATGPTYRPSAADLGARISARGQLTRPGFTPAAVLTPPTARVRTVPALTLTTTPGAGRVDLRATVSAVGTTPTGVVRVRSGGRLLVETALRDGTASTRLTGLGPGEHRLRVIVPTTRKLTRAAVVHWVTVR
jgi:surface antigen